MGRGGEGGGHGGGNGHFNYSRGRSSSSRYRNVYYPMSTRSTLALFIIVTVVMFVSNFLNGSKIQTSTVERTKLSSSQCKVIDTWYEDEVDWIHDERELLKGLKKFYEETGVQPYLWVTDNIYGKAKPTASDFESALQKKYYELFADEGHLIVCFMESSPSNYATYYWAGGAAKGVIDSEAGEILLDVIDSKYTSDLSDEEMFSKSFEEAAERMMKVGKTTKQYIYITICLALLVSAIVGVIFHIKTKHRLEAAKAEESRKILNTDIDEMVDSVLDKYGKEK